MSRVARRLDALPGPLLQLGVVIAQLAAFVPIAVARDIDGDEGYYTLAASLVSDGKLPYVDFFYPQMPLLPFAYGPWTSVFGESWFGARSLSVLCAAGTGLLLYRHASGRWRSRPLGLLAVALYASSMLVLTWMTVVKTYPLSTLILVGAFVLADRPDLPQTPRRWLASGLLLGVGLDARLLFAATVPVFLLYALRATPGAAGRRLAAAHVAGLGLGLIPALALAAPDPRRFYFDNLGYHSVRSPGGMFGSLTDKLEVFGELLVDYPQFTILLIAAVAAVVVGRRSGDAFPLSYTLAGALAVAGLAPNPPFTQDFSTIVPFMVCGALGLVASVPMERAGAWPRRAAVAALVAYLAVPLVQLPRNASGGFLGGGDFVADAFRPSNVRRVTESIDEHSSPGQQVLAFWPGHLFGSEAEPVPGFEDDFATQGVINAGYSEEKARRYDLASPRFLDDLVRRRGVGLVVIGTLGDWTKRHDSLPLILRSGYRPVDQVGVTRILGRGDPGPAAAIERCLRRAGLRPRLSPRVRDATPIAASLPGGDPVRLFVYPSARRARQATADVARLLRLDPGAVTQAGPTVFAYKSAIRPAGSGVAERCGRTAP